MFTTNLFQFHKGAIRTIALNVVMLCVQRFQFHKGAIRTQLLADNAKAYADFNSIKVRLEPLQRQRGQRGVAFQFHKGAIRTLRGNHQRFNLRDFNSIKVRLEQEFIYWFCRRRYISIP